MFTPADIRSPLLLIKSKKLSEQPGMVLMGNPPRWHQLKPDEMVPKDVHHALHKKGEIAAATKLSKDPEFQKLSPEEQVAKVQAHAKEVQDKNTASSKVATWKKKILSGQAPQPLEWKSFFALPRDKQNALFAELKADPETSAKLDEAMAKFRMEAVKNIQEKAPEADKKTDTVSVSRFQLGKAINFFLAGKGGSTLKPSYNAISQAAAHFGVTKKEAKKAFDAYAWGDEALKPGEKVDVSAEAWEQANPTQDKKPDIEADQKPAEPDEYEAKIQEYATGATYKQKAYKILSKDPDWQKLSAKDKFEALHDQYLMEQEKASLAGAMAKFKAALLSGKAPTKALVEKFNSLSKDDQAKVLKPVFEQKDKAEIGKLLEQSGAGNAPKAESQKASETDSPKDGDTKQGADGLLVFKNGRWHKQGKPEKAAKPEPAERVKPAKMVKTRTVEKKTKKTKIKSEPPTLNYWTSKTNAVNHIKINPPVGKKFSEKESADLKGWLESEGYDVKIYDSFIDVFDPAYGSAISNIPSGSALQKENKAKESQQAYSEKKKESEDAKSGEYENSPSYAWIESKMGSDFTNTHNKLMLARFLDGVDKQFNGLTSKGWIEPLTQLGYKHQPGDGNDVVFKFLKDSYLKDKTEDKPEPEKPVEAKQEKAPEADEKPDIEADKKLTAKAAEALAYELGKKAHAAGHSAPATDDDLLKLLGQLSDAGVSTSAAQKAWYKGKTDAMLADPVPGWTDAENQELAQAMGGEAPAETQVGKGTAWVTALAAGKKPDADIDNAIVTMPEERQQELFMKAAASWAKTQGLESDENGAALGKLVLSDVMNDREHHEGDIKTINGVSYILQNGRWHRVQKATNYGPQQKLEAMQAFGSSDLMDEIDSGKISAKTDKLLDVMGPEAKASFYNWVATYKDYGFTVYRKAAVCAAYGHPNEVLLKDGTWVPFDPAMNPTSLAVPSDIHLQAVKEATLAAQNEPSTGPENPDTPQSFGHGTVTFVGPSKLHNLLAGKGWDISQGPNFKHTFLKNMLDWSISQSKDDYNDWKQTVFHLHDMFPVGATVKFDDSGKSTWKVIQGEKGVTFKNVLTGEVQNYKNKEDVAQLMGVLWNVNPTVIPPGHPAGKTLRDPVSDTVKVDSPEINVNGISYKKVDDVWQFKNSHGDWVAPQFSEKAISTLESKLADLQPKPWLDEMFRQGESVEESPVVTMDLPFVGETNYKKVNGVWMTEDQKGNPDAGWHAINQDGGIVKDLEDKLKAAQGDGYDVMQHPAVKDYIEMLSHSVNPTSGQTISLNSAIGDNGTKVHDEVIKQAAKEYAKLHNLKDNDPDDQALALDIVSGLAYGDKGPQEGDTKTKNGHTYQLINGRWHRVDKDGGGADGTVSLPDFPGVKFKNVDGVWNSVLADGSLSPVAEGWAADKKLKEKYGSGSPLAKTSPFDAIKSPHQAIDDSTLSPIQKDKLKEQLENLKAAAQQDGIAAFKGVLKYMTKSGKTIVKIPNGYKITIHDNKDWNKPWANDVLEYIHDLKAATELVSGKKPKKAAPKKTSTASVSPVIPSKTVMVGGAKAKLIDDWQQTGPQGGSNPGGQFTDKNGKQWYCKFPDNPEVCKNEFLATKFYQMLGVSVPDMVLVQKDGKLGVATKWVDGLTKGSPKQLAEAKGAHEAFAIDAWLANWDVVGLANDNLLLDKDGKALRADAGGALIFRAQGGPKGDAFGNEVSELDTLTDASKNPQAAAVFGNISKENMDWGIGQLNKLKPSQIEELVDAIGPGTAEEKKALAKKLIARRADILKKFNIRDQWDKKPPDITKLPVDPKDLPSAIDFNNFPGTGKPLSSVPEINNANTAASQALINFASQGNLEALKTYQFDEYDKNTHTYTGKKIPIENHPSKHIQEQWAGLVQMLQSIAYPPADTLDMPPLGTGETPDEIAREIGSFAPDKNISNIPPEHVLGYFMKLGQVGQDVVESLKTAVDWKWTSPNKNAGYFQMLKGVYAKARQSVKEYISAVQSTGYVNHIWSQGKKSWQNHGINQLTADIYADAVEVEEGTQMWRWMDDDTAGKMMTKQFLASHPGDILQNTDSMCTSFHEHWNQSPHFVSNPQKAMLMRIRCVKGVKMTPTYATGSLGNEGEFTTLPGQRFIVIDIQKGGKLHPDGVFLDVIALPPDDGFVAQLGAASKS